MTREELFSIYPRPWRLMEEEEGVVLCADGSEALRVDGKDGAFLEDIVAMAEVIVELVNAHHDGSPSAANNAAETGQ